MKDAMTSKINIIYEDNHLLVVEKPVNIPSQADDTNDPDMITILKQDIKERYNKPGNVYLGLVHRLDRPVGGVMVFAKTSKAAARLSEDIRNRAFRKIYMAVIHGVPEKRTQTLRHYLCKDNNTNTVSVVTGNARNVKEAKEAVLDYELIAGNGRLSLVKVNLHTGRPHQIRVQLAEIGHPLYGDQKYGSGYNKPGQQIALWCQEISFKHPTREEEMKFISKPPQKAPWNDFGI